MRFLYVNRILDITDSSIVGEKIFAEGEPLRSGLIVAPGTISEAIGQLASWCVLRRTQFFGRPVFMFADRIEFFNDVRVGEKVVLRAQIDRIDGNDMVFSGYAEGAAGLICRITSCHCHLVPLVETEDLDITKKRYDNLCASGELYGDAEAFSTAAAILDRKWEPSLGKLNGTAKFSAQSFFYPDHFPRRPVTPIIMINEAIGELTKSIYAAEVASGRLVPRAVDGLKIRNFILPDESFSIHIDVVSRDTDENNVRRLQTITQVRKEEKMILRGRYSYEWRMS